jgi:outer membrane protein assembly factor BamA
MGALSLFPPPQVARSPQEVASAEKPDLVVPPQPSSQGSSLASRVKSRSRNYPRRDSRTAINLGNEHLNAIFGGFEQGAGFGGGIELTTADSLPGIELRATALVSTRFYRAAEFGAYIPKIGDERTHADIWYSYSRRTRDRFFGIGPRTPESDKTNFDLEQRSASGALFRDFTNHFQAGLYLGYTDSDAYRGQRKNEPFIDVLFSNNPAVMPITRFVPGLHSGSKTVAYGIFGEYDRRNNERGLTRGVYLYGRVASVDGLEKSAFSDYGWVEGEFDVRGYLPLGSNKTSLALRVASELKAPKGGSQIPFYELARLGGRSYVRGFDTFRFYGQNLLLGSVELRQTVYAKEEDRGVDVVVFGDAGQVWGDSRSQTNAAVRQNNRFDSSNWRASLGGGIQYRHSKSFGFRIDFGHSNEANKVYFSVSRGF